MNHEKKDVVPNLDEVIKLITSDEFDKFNHHYLTNEIPKKCIEEPCILGVDEAGRGPVLGPMVYAVCYCPLNVVGNIKSIGCTDSKALTEKKREEIFEEINNYKDEIGWAVDIISPNFISNKMLKRVKYSLNEIAQSSTINLIKSLLDKNVCINEIYVDTIGPADKYQAKLSELFPKCKVKVDKKADSLYPIVGAASICAKVIRDNVVQNWRFPESIDITDSDFGTGYPGDPKSKKFLSESRDEIFGFPHLVRFSWSTADKLLEECVPVEWKPLIYKAILKPIWNYGIQLWGSYASSTLKSSNEFNPKPYEPWDDKAEGTDSGKVKISAFFKPLNSTVKHKTKAGFFKERCLSSLDSF